MDKIFNSPVIIKLQEFGQKLGQNKFLSALQGAMMSLMAVIMVGAISQIITSVLGESMLNIVPSTSALYGLLKLPYVFTMTFLAIWIVIILAFFYSRNLGLKSPIMSSVQAVLCFLLVSTTFIVNEAGVNGIDVTYFGSTGMFVGFFICFMTVRIEKFCVDKNIRIKMPEAVPPFLQDGFAGIVPLVLNILICVVLFVAVQAFTGGTHNVASWFMLILSKPLGALSSVPGMFIITIFAAILWCLGIHGAMVIAPIIMPLVIEAAMANGAAHAAGQALTFYPIALYGSMSLCGGAGNTLPLTLMGLKAKSEQIRAISKASVIPGWFGINEPVTFGMPIMYNPLLCIPYVLNIPVVMLCTYFLYKVGLLMPSWITITALLPMGFAGYLSTLNIFNGIWPYLSMIPVAIVYYPFFKAYDNQLYKKEQEIKNNA